MRARLRGRSGTRLASLLIVCTALLATAGDAAQFGPRRGFRLRVQTPTPESFDGRFNFCRVMFQSGRYRNGGGWGVDYPRADINLSFRLSELTTTRVGRSEPDEFNNVVLRLTDPQVSKCPFIMMTEVGNTYLDDQEAAHLRDYLLRGGFLWADDFWGEWAWEVWESQIRKALPSGPYPTVDLPLDHPIFRTHFDLRSGVLQIPSINFWQTVAMPY